MAATTWCRLSCTPLRQMLKTMTLSSTGSACADDSATKVARMNAQNVRSKRMSPPLAEIRSFVAISMAQAAMRLK